MNELRYIPGKPVYDIILANRTQLILLSIIYATIVPYELTSRM